MAAQSDPESPRGGGGSLSALFRAFFRIGLTAFGGPAMIPHIRKLATERMGLITEKDFRLGLSICQMIPGATVMQLAAYVGFRARGLAGALAAFIGFGLPAFLLITLLSALYFAYQDISWVLHAFEGLKIVVVAIIAHAAIDFVRKYTKCVADVLIAAIAACAILLRVHPALIIAAAMLLGVLIYRDAQLSEGPTPGRPDPAERGAFLKLSVGLGLLLFGALACSGSLFQLMLRMARVDLFAFGGGFAALPMMLHEAVHTSGWLSERAFLDGIALGQITPGPIVITAAFVGYAVQGLAGAAAGTIGIFSPSILLLVWAVPHCDRLLGSALFRRAMNASLATLGGLMAATVFILARPVEWDGAGIALGLGAIAALRLKADVLWVVTAGVLVSLAMSLWT